MIGRLDNVASELRCYYCSKCGRVVTRHSKDWPLWLIGVRVDDPAKLVSRCPQHITERTLRYAGRKRAKKNYKWARYAREHDPYPWLSDNYSPVMPAPLPESVVTAWYEPGKLAPALRRLNGVKISEQRRKVVLRIKKRTL